MIELCVGEDERWKVEGADVEPRCMRPGGESESAVEMEVGKSQEGRSLGDLLGKSDRDGEAPTITDGC